MEYGREWWRHRNVRLKRSLPLCEGNTSAVICISICFVNFMQRICCVLAKICMYCISKYVFLTIHYCNFASRCRVDVKGLGCSDVSQWQYCDVTTAASACCKNSVHIFGCVYVCSDMTSSCLSSYRVFSTFAVLHICDINCFIPLNPFCTAKSLFTKIAQI